MPSQLEILIVDDSKVIQMYLKEILTTLNAKVSLACNGEQALTLIADQEFSAIFMDIEMPGKSGLEVIRLVREHLLFKYTPIIVITGLQDQALIQRAFDYGASDYVRKPLFAHEVLARLKVRLDNRQLDRQLMEAKRVAEQASLAKSEFITRLAHELKTPLNAISGFAQLIQASTADKEILESISYVVDAANFQKDLINEASDLAQIEAGIIEIKQGPVELDAIIKDTFNLLRPLASKTGVKLILPRRNLVMYSVNADSKRLKQVFLNIVSNAVKYNRPNGEVSLVIQSSADGWVNVGIKDTGQGIKASDIPKLFEAFNRLEAAASEIEGTGIGLPIAKKLTELMGANLSVESTIGEGSTFWLRLRGSKSQEAMPTTVIMA